MAIGRARRPLQTARLAFLPPALLGRAVSDRLATTASIEALAENRAAARCRRSSTISSRPAPASRRWRKAKEWVRYSDTATRETNTMPQWAGSCWYYLRFCDPRNDERFVGEEAEALLDGRRPKPGGVDLYVGGTEHAVLHLLVCALLAQGALRSRLSLETGAVPAAGEPGNDPRRRRRKMSKRWGNVIDPLDVIAEYGADAFRCYEMFMGRWSR